MVLHSCALLHDVPASYFVVPLDGSTQWIPQHRVTEDVELLVLFESLPRSEGRPGEPVPADRMVRSASPEEWDTQDSHDEVDLILASELYEMFGFHGVGA